MTLDEIRDRLADESVRSRWVGLWIAVLALMLAFGSWAGSNAAGDAQRLTVEVSNAWAFYQAKNIRGHALRVAIEQASLEPQPGAADATARSRQIKAWSDEAAALYSDPQTDEGMKELADKARKIAKARDAALHQDSRLGLAQMLLQLAVVFASVAIMTGWAPPITWSAVVGAMGLFQLCEGMVS